jgi:hypothetical protein
MNHYGGNTMNIQTVRNRADYECAIRRIDNIEYELAYEFSLELSIELDLIRDSMLEYERKPKVFR